MPRYTEPNSASDQELDEILGDIERWGDLSEEEFAQEREAEAALAAERAAKHHAKQLKELARHEALEKLRASAAAKRSAELAKERAGLDDALTPLRSFASAPIAPKPEIVEQPAADKKSPSEVPPADDTFPDLSDLLDQPGLAKRPTHCPSIEKETIFFRELRRRSSAGHPFRDARDPLTGRSASVLLNTPSPSAPITPPAADKKSPTHTFKSAPPWRDLTPRGRAVYGIEAAKAGGRARAITIGLGDIIKAKAPHQKDGALRFIMKAIDKGLKRAFDNAPPLFVTLEHSGDIGLHLHGIVELSDHQIDRVAKVIREAVGVWREHADKQIDIKPIMSRGWGTYITKHSAEIEESSGHRAYYMSNDLRRRAEEIHKSDCEFLKLSGGLVPTVSQI